MTIEEIKARVSLKDEVERRGVKLVKSGGTEWKGCCPIHKDTNPSFYVNVEKAVWQCHGCQRGGSVIDLVMQLDGLGFREAFLKLGGDGARSSEETFDQGKTVGAVDDELPAKPPGPRKIEKIYSYQDANGNEVFQVVRYEGKDFRQRHADGRGGWVWNLQGVERVLYHLPDVLRAQEVWNCEGERDVETLVEMGLVATCNPGGAKKWMDGYTESLAGKDVVVCGDNDKAGQEHVGMVLASIAHKVKTSRQVKIPAPYKDVSEWAAAFNGKTAEAAQTLLAMRDAARVFIRGVDLPILSMEDMEERYLHFLRNVDTMSLSLARWLPSFGKLRKLVPGEVVIFIADTGVGKTALLSHVAFYARPLKVLMFEMELPDTLLFERFIQQSGGLRAEEVEQEYKNGVSWKEGISVFLNHIFCCPKSGLDLAEMKRILNLAELKLGERPRVVIVDYLQLCRTEGKSRYESIASAAEGLKVMAMETQTIVVCASQMSRPGEKKGPVGLHDAKGAGEIENSGGLVIGANREENGSTMTLKVLKQTKGFSGMEIICNFDGATMSITERAPEFNPIPVGKQAGPRHND